MAYFLKAASQCLLFVISCIGVGSAAAAVPAEFSIGDVPGWVAVVLPDTAARLPPEKQSGGVSWLLVDRQVFAKGEAKQAYVHTAMKIENESGLESASNIEMRFDPSYQKLVVHAVTIRRGDKVLSKLTPASVRILQRERSLDYLVYDGTKAAHLFLEDVRVGDVIEYAYTLIGANPVFSGKHSGQFDLQWGIPVLQVYGRVLTEKGRNPTIKLVNTQQAPVVRSFDNMQEYVWSLKDVEALRSSDDTPYGFNPYPSVQWSDFKDWASVVLWSDPLYKVAARLPKELAIEAERIKTTYSKPGDRAMEALRYVQRTVRYLGVEVGPGSHAPNQPDVVLSRRFGDCKDKTLLTLMLLKELGIEAHAALVNTKIRRGVNDRQPAPSAFDHVLVSAVVDSEMYWLDLTLPAQAGSIQDISQPNYGFALVLAPGQTALTPIKVGSATTYTRRVISVFDTRGNWMQPVKLTVTTVLEGISAENLRNTLAKESVESMQKSFVNYFARYYPAISVERPYEVSDNKATNQITLVEYYRIPDFWKSTKKDKVEAYVAAPDVSEYVRAPQNTVRNEPMALVHPADIRQTTYVQVPDDVTFKAETYSVKDPAFELESTSSFATGRLVLVDSYRSLSDSVEVKNLPAYLANAKKARDLLGSSLSRAIAIAP